MFYIVTIGYEKYSIAAKTITEFDICELQHVLHDTGKNGRHFYFAAKVTLYKKQQKSSLYYDIFEIKTLDLYIYSSKLFKYGTNPK